MALAMNVFRAFVQTQRGRLLNTGVKNVLCSRTYGGGHDEKPFVPINAPPNEHVRFKLTTLDDMPKPQGDWLEDYNKRNRKYWIEFICGLSIFSATLFTIFYNELIFFNAFPPELPPKEERIKSFWEPPEDDDDDDDDE